MSEHSVRPSTFKLRYPHSNLSISLEVAREEDFAPIYQVITSATYRWLDVNRGDTVLDAGANTGVFTSLASRLVGPEGSVVAVEPDPSNYRRLTRTIELGGLKNVTPVNAALWSNLGEELTLTGQGIMTKVSANPIGSGIHQRTAETVTAGDLLRLVGAARFNKVKMDIEGAEVPVLQSRANACILEADQVGIEFHSLAGADLLRSIFSESGFVESRTLPNSQDWLELARGIVFNPLSSARMELLNRFATTSRVLRHFTRRIYLDPVSPEYSETAFFVRQARTV